MLARLLPSSRSRSPFLSFFPPNGHLHSPAQRLFVFSLDFFRPWCDAKNHGTEMESVFSEMDRFAADVVSYCTRNLSVSQHTGGAASSTAPGRLKHELRMLLSRAGTSARRLLQPTNPPTTPTTPKETQDAFGLTATSTDVVVVGNDDGVSHAGEPVDADGVPANTNGDTDSVRVGTGEAGARARAATAAAGAFARREAVQEQRCQQAELCAVVAEQWRKSAAALARSRCVRSRNGGADAKERREVGDGTFSYFLAPHVS